MKIKNFRFVMLIILGIIFFWSIVVQAEGGTQAEQIIQSFMADKGMNIQPGTEEYILFMRAILWGVYPELRESDSTFIKHPDEVGYISDYAWIHSGYEELYGGYIEPNIEEAPAPPSESNLQARITSDVRLSYNRSKAIDYAYAWSQDGGKKRNANYPDFGRDDCTNFISQAMEVGGYSQSGGGDGCKHENTSKEWYVTSNPSPSWTCLGGFRNWKWSTSWSVAWPFRQYFAFENNYAQELGWTQNTDTVKYHLSVGDVLQLQRKDNNNNWMSYHTMLVTKEDENDLYLTYHSNMGGNDEVDRPLSWFNLASNERYMLVKMYYPEAYLPDVRSGHNGWDTALHIRNDGARSATVVITLFNPNGSEAETEVIEDVRAGQRLYYNPTRNNWRGSIIVSASEAVSVLVAHQHLNPDKFGAYTGVNHPTSTVHVPLLLRNVHGINSTLAIQNTGGTATEVTIQFHRFKHGRDCPKTYTVQANGVKNINLSDLSCVGQVFVGSAHISNDQNHPLAMATTQEEDKVITAASNLHPGASTLYAPLIQYGQPGSWEIFSSGSVQNTGEHTGKITTGYHNVDGSQCGGHLWINKNIGGHKMFNAIPMPPDGNGCNDPVVAAKIDGDGQQRIAWINQRRDKAVSTYEAIGQGSQAISIPYWHNAGSWDTGLSLQNLANAATTVTIVFYNPDGSYNSTRRVSLAAKGRDTYGWGKPTHEFTGSAFVTATNPIVAIVNVLDYQYEKGQADGLMSYTPVPRLND